MFINSYTDYDNLIRIVNESYQVNAENIQLHRDGVGRVYFLENKYVLKIYRSFYADNALQTIEILEYLKNYNFLPPKSYRQTLAA
jgi:hypothetical protein